MPATADVTTSSSRSERDTRAADEALVPPPRPTAAQGSFEWDVADPATKVIGEWRTPTSLAEGLAMLGEVQEARRARLVELGHHYEEVVRLRLHREWGFRTVEDFCLLTLGCSARTMQRSLRLARTLRTFPALGALPLTKAEAIGRVAKAEDVDRWLAVAGRVGVFELQRAVAHVEAGSEAAAGLLASYERAIAQTTTTVALERVQRPVPPTQTDRVHPDLPRAASWFLAHVPLPERRGCGKAVERADYRCGNPECRGRSLRVQSHHFVFRSRGGTDLPENLGAVCVSCHLRGIHAGHVDVSRAPPVTVWTFPDRAVTVFDAGFDLAETQVSSGQRSSGVG